MPESFTSHQFILRLAQANQTEYVEALYSYRDSVHGSNTAPFKAVHTRLSQHLQEYPTLIRHTGNVPSVDIFGQQNSCSSWKKV
jgi:hypothetical protein